MTVSRPDSITVEVDQPASRAPAAYRRTARPTRPLAWNGFLLLWYALAWASGSWLVFLMPLLHVVVGIGIVYWIVAELVNRTTLTIDRGFLSVRHAPLPWPGAVDVELDRVLRIFVHRRTEEGTTFRSLRADVDGVELELIGNIEREEQALYLDRVLTRYLDGTDDPTANDPA